jgi:hypothetical protein
VEVTAHGDSLELAMPQVLFPTPAVCAGQFDASADGERIKAHVLNELRIYSD